VLVALNPGDIPRVKEINLDFYVLGWTILLSVLTGVLSGLAPALQVSRPNLNETLQEGGRGADPGAARKFGGRSSSSSSTIVGPGAW